MWIYSQCLYKSQDQKQMRVLTIVVCLLQCIYYNGKTDLKTETETENK
jgi:hypothetical protein